jgi:hypothetical protein
MPTHALIRLERLRGTDDHSIIEQLLKTAACVALAVVLLLLPARENVAYASEAYAASIDNNTNYRVFEDGPAARSRNLRALSAAGECSSRRSKTQTAFSSHRSTPAASKRSFSAAIRRRQVRGDGRPK